MSAALCIAALAASNFLYQAVTSRDWAAATERSFFQAVAVLIFVVAYQ